jgi:hypothetical protein
MKQIAFLRQRLANQQLCNSAYTSAADLVKWFGAVQAQDFAMAKWALGVRLLQTNETLIDNAYNKGEIIRTHVLRPTWHFVHPSDIRWMLQLTAPRVHQFMGTNYRKLGLDKAVFASAIKTLEKNMQGGRQLTKKEITAAFHKAKINTDDLRLSHLLIHAELEGVICSGPRAGKLFTYMLLDEQVPPTNKKNQDEALAELTLRYFQSHGPATARDFAWWSGLTTTEAKKGIGLYGSALISELIGNDTHYWFSDASASSAKSNKVFLLPNFDEYSVAYANRNVLIDPENKKLLAGPAASLLGNNLVVNGKIEGTWKRTLKGKKVSVEIHSFGTLSPALNSKVQRSIKEFTDFFS